MTDSERIRDRSVRLFALALKAREDGKLLMAAELEKLAIEASSHATEVDQREVQTVVPRTAAHEQPAQHPPVQQQQQQPSSDKEADKPKTDKRSGAESP